MFCKQHNGYTYYLQAQFILLCVIVLFQARGAGWQPVLCKTGRDGSPGRQGWRTRPRACRPQQPSSYFLSASLAPPSSPLSSHCLVQVGGSLLFIVHYYYRRLTTRLFGIGTRRASSPRSGSGNRGTSTPYVSGAQLAIAIAPGSAGRFGDVAHLPHDLQQVRATQARSGQHSPLPHHCCPWCSPGCLPAPVRLQASYQSYPAGSETDTPRSSELASQSPVRRRGVGPRGSDSPTYVD